MEKKKKELGSILKDIFRQPITVRDITTLSLLKQELPPYTRIRTYKEMELERAIVYVHIPSLLKDLEEKGYPINECDLVKTLHEHLHYALGKRMKDNELYAYGFIEFGGSCIF